MKELNQYILEKFKIKKGIDLSTFWDILKDFEIDYDEDDMVGIAYIHPEDAKYYDEDWGGGYAPCLTISILDDETWIPYDENAEDNVNKKLTIVTGYSKNGDEKLRNFNIKGKLDTTEDGKAYIYSRDNASVIANILINKKVI